MDEGFEETLTLHRLGLFKALGPAFKTPNGLDNLTAQIKGRTGKVEAWKNAEQKQRWRATPLLDIAPHASRAGVSSLSATLVRATEAA